MKRTDVIFWGAVLGLFLVFPRIEEAAAGVRGATWMPRAQLQPAQEAASTWTDPETERVWTAKDNEYDLNWQEAMDYCSALRTGGFQDWELAPIQELQKAYYHHIAKHIRQTSCCSWSSTKNGEKEAWQFSFVSGSRYSSALSRSQHRRALCVRHSGK